MYSFYYFILFYICSSLGGQKRLIHVIQFYFYFNFLFFFIVGAQLWMILLNNTIKRESILMLLQREHPHKCDPIQMYSDFNMLSIKFPLNCFMQMQITGSDVLLLGPLRAIVCLSSTVPSRSVVRDAQRDGLPSRSVFSSPLALSCPLAPHQVAVNG